jgi:hypothetical protein
MSIDTRITSDMVFQFAAFGIDNLNLRRQPQPRPAAQPRPSFLEPSQPLLEAAVTKEVDGAQGGGVREAIVEHGAVRLSCSRRLGGYRSRSRRGFASKPPGARPRRRRSVEEEVDAPRVEVLAARRDGTRGGHGEVRAVVGAAGVWPPANCQLPTANCQLKTANGQLQTAN